jgi:hypothetical protein
MVFFNAQKENQRGTCLNGPLVCMRYDWVCCPLCVECTHFVAVGPSSERGKPINPSNQEGHVCWDLVPPGHCLAMNRDPDNIHAVCV